MRIKEEMKVIEQKVVTYIAEDGTEFVTKKECQEHEEKLILGKAIAMAEKLRIKELDDVIPLSTQDYNPNNLFRWYEVNSVEDMKVLKEAYWDLSMPNPKTYPEIVCVETLGDEPYHDECYEFTLSYCKRETEDFWKTLGYKVTLEKL